MIEAFVPDGEYVERLATRADEALASVKGVWPLDVPVEVRDDAGLFHPGRYVAYCARAAEPDDDEMKLFRDLITGLPERYALPSWRAKRSIEHIVEWVRDPARTKFVNVRASTPGLHAHRVFTCARHVVRVAAAGALRRRGQTNAEIADRLGCTERHVRTLVALAQAPAKERPRWENDEIEALRKAVTRKGSDSERSVCLRFAKDNGRSPEAVRRQWKRIKRKDAEAQAGS